MARRVDIFGGDVFCTLGTAFSIHEELDLNIFFDPRLHVEDVKQLPDMRNSMRKWLAINGACYVCGYLRSHFRLILSMQNATDLCILAVLASLCIHLDGKSLTPECSAFLEVLWRELMSQLLSRYALRPENAE